MVATPLSDVRGLIASAGTDRWLELAKFAVMYGESIYICPGYL